MEYGRIYPTADFLMITSKLRTTMTLTLSDCGVMQFQAMRSELDLQRSLGLTTTDDWGPFKQKCSQGCSDATSLSPEHRTNTTPAGPGGLQNTVTTRI